MTLYLWMDEHGVWRVSHFPPSRENPCVLVALDGNASFIDLNTSQEIQVEVRRG